MKSVKQKSVYLLIAAALIAFVANSCRKDVHPSEPQVAPEQLKDAKSWYQANYPFKETGQGKKVNEANDGEIDFSQLIQPDWDEANTYDRFGDEVMELPEDASGAIGANLAGNIDDSLNMKKEYSKSSFLLLKNNGTYKAYIMTIIADPDYIGANLAKLDSNKYNKRDSDFTGAVLYSTPNGQFVNGWVYKNGNITRRLRPDQVSSSSVNKSKSTHRLRVDTYTTAIRYCTDWYQKINNQWVYLDTQCHTIYGTVDDWDGGASGGGGGSSGGGGGNGSSPGAPPTNPCEPAPEMVVRKTNGLKTHYNAPANPGTTPGFPPPAAPPPCDAEILVLPQNKLCASTFVFKQIVQPNAAQGSRGWKEASVAKLTINAVSDNYLENIWNTVTTGSGVATGVFNLEVGVPGDLPNHLITAETALAANITMIELEKSYGVSGLKTLINNGTLGVKVAQLMQIHLQAVIDGSRVSSHLSGKTIPTSPVTGINCK